MGVPHTNSHLSVLCPSAEETETDVHIGVVSMRLLLNKSRAWIRKEASMELPLGKVQTLDSTGCLSERMICGIFRKLWFVVESMEYILFIDT